MIKLPMLYNKTATGKIQTWEIWTVRNVIHSESGKLNGKMIPTTDTIKSGKNIGKKNETNKKQQARLEAKSKWIAKKKKGFVESLEDAELGLVSSLVDGGYEPTLAHKFEKREKDIRYPCAAQPKLDGIRSTYTGESNMWSRTRKKVISVPHIPKALKNVCFEMVDGELYNHDYKDDFETITHLVGQKKKPDPDHELVQYHVYDIPSDEPFLERMNDLKKLGRLVGKDSPIKIVETIICNTKEDLLKCMDNFLEAGYEGAMVRNLHAPYEYKRSKHLQKLKLFDDAEFKIVGAKEGRGKMQGYVGSFICITPEKNKFKAKIKGNLQANKFDDYKKHVGKTLTVQFQGYTNKNNVPRFPVALRFRDDE